MKNTKKFPFFLIPPLTKITLSDIVIITSDVVIKKEMCVMAQLSSDIMRGYNDVIVLSILAEGDSYGYEISRCITERSSGRYPIKETTLYSTFARLERNGYIRSYVGTETFGRRRAYSGLTGSGRRCLTGKCEHGRRAPAVMGSLIYTWEQ